MSNWFACGVIRLAKPVLGEFDGKSEEKKEIKEKGGKEGSWPTLQEVGFSSSLVDLCLRVIQWP